ncbi:MAG TPA: hypothetical protein PKE45_08230 [Caldilineaceae bacterium]|nr:hypothetical protein [Caldilineaceae bacterium]
MKVIVDTNVLHVAHGRNVPQASPQCIKSCASILIEIRSEHVLVLDHARHILREYGRQFSHPATAGVGYEFYVWILQNLSNMRHCELVPITLLPNSDDHSDFAEFPRDILLTNFDRSDRKFVAVALAHPDHPPILNAVDTDWRDHETALARHGIQVRFLCPDAMNV